MRRRFGRGRRRTRRVERERRRGTHRRARPDDRHRGGGAGRRAADRAGRAGWRAGEPSRRWAQRRRDSLLVGASPLGGGEALFAALALARSRAGLPRSRAGHRAELVDRGQTSAARQRAPAPSSSRGWPLPSSSEGALRVQPADPPRAASGRAGAGGRGALARRGSRDLPPRAGGAGGSGRQARRQHSRALRPRRAAAAHAAASPACAPAPRACASISPGPIAPRCPWRGEGLAAALDRLEGSLAQAPERPARPQLRRRAAREPAAGLRTGRRAAPRERLARGGQRVVAARSGRTRRRGAAGGGCGPRASGPARRRARSWTRRWIRALAGRCCSRATSHRASASTGRAC